MDALLFILFLLHTKIVRIDVSEIGFSSSALASKKKIGRKMEKNT